MDRKYFTISLNEQLSLFFSRTSRSPSSELGIKVEGIVCDGDGGLKRRLNLLLQQPVPVDGREERVALDLDDAVRPGPEPILRRSLEQDAQEQLGLGAEELGHLQLGLHDLVHRVFSVRPAERQLARQHFVLNRRNE